MLEVLFCLAIGAFIGWNLPQPFWAKAIQEWVITKWNEFKAK